ncbi:OLC1v1002142C1 [Oldenlandia corymbosa var. corymbosa]|uniref:OLC1v1002142C1 n=1 Tax=Oldenlandia corymbosa var. corymbosa TaxID=529605 RepID=A0AAV1D9U6_OLDCO|nr:OLC1v1002142C1 [Oldenlandia corymbosa var. corymbosa]
MARTRRKQVSDSSAQENESPDGKSSSEGAEIPESKRVPKNNINEYERQRMKRIEENRARMEALGMKKMADSFVGSIPKPSKTTIESKGKRKLGDDDEEYTPSDGEKALDSSSEDDEAKNNEDDEDYSCSTAKRKTKKRNRTPKKKASPGKHFDESDFVDDDEALLHAIALSLQDSTGLADSNSLESQSSTPPAVNSMSNEKKHSSHDQGNTVKRKIKKSMNSRVQMTEDDLILYFFRFDEVGRGGITVRDLRRMATTHDFTWSDQEMEDMIKYFDSNGDGQVSLDDFREIAGRCGMMQGS